MSVSCEQIIRDMLSEMPDIIKERLIDGENPQNYEGDELMQMVEVLNDHIGFLRASLKRTKETLAEQERHNRVLRAECQFLSNHVNQEDWDDLMAKMSNYIMSLSQEEYDSVFKSMGGKKIETAFGTVCLIPAFKETEEL